eukprot:scpid61795/ scgid29518/ 
MSQPSPWKHKNYRQWTPHLTENMTPGVVRAHCYSERMISDIQLKKLQAVSADSMEHNERLLDYLGGGNAESFHLFCEIIREHESRYVFGDMLGQFAVIDPLATNEDLVLRPGPPTGASTGAERDGGHATEPADPRMASSAQCHQPVDPLILGPNGLKKLSDLDDIEGLADSIRSYLTPDMRELLARHAAEFVDEKLLRNYRIVLPDYMDDNHKDMRGKADIKNVHGILHWLRAQKNCPTLNDLYGILTTICRQNSRDFSRILGHKHLR